MRCYFFGSHNDYRLVLIAALICSDIHSALLIVFSFLYFLSFPWFLFLLDVLDLLFIPLKSPSRRRFHYNILSLFMCVLQNFFRYETCVLVKKVLVLSLFFFLCVCLLYHLVSFKISLNCRFQLKRKQEVMNFSWFFENKTGDFPFLKWENKWIHD